MSDNMVRDIFDNMCTQFLPERAINEKAVISFDLSGELGGMYYAHVENGTCATGAGSPPTAADITISADAEDFVSLVTGKISPIIAMTTGKFKVKGPMGMALKFVQWFKLG